MKNRSRRYLLIKKASRNRKQCGEFPYFGARYPDATCIDGMLLDLDKYDGEGLYGGGEEPCPFCNTHAFIEQHEDNYNGNTLENLCKYIKELRLKYQ